MGTSGTVDISGFVLKVELAEDVLSNRSVFSLEDIIFKVLFSVIGKKEQSLKLIAIFNSFFVSISCLNASLVG